MSIEQWQARIIELEERAQLEAGVQFNVASPVERAKVLHEVLRLPVLARTPKTRRPKVDGDTLRKLKEKHPHPVIDLFLERESLAKLVGTYAGPESDLVTAIGPDGRVHPTLKTTRTSTGRLASENPNGQNIPIRSELGRMVRNAFIAPPGRVLLSWDFSQIELKVMAHLSQDPSMIAVFHRKGLAGDLHTMTAARVLNKAPEYVTPDERQAAKSTGFGIIYGITAVGLAENLGWPRDRAQGYIGEYLALYPGVRAYMEEQKRKVSVLGYVETIFGRRRYFPEYLSRDFWVREKMYKEAINMPDQGTAQDVIKIAMAQVNAVLLEQGFTTYYSAGRECDVEWMMQIHDDLLSASQERCWRQVAKVVKGVMEGAAELSVPLVAECKVGARWGELEKVSV